MRAAKPSRKGAVEKRTGLDARLWRTGHRQIGYARPMRIALLVLGLLAVAMGLLWVGQGLGWVLWPKSSFMLNQPKWSWYGAALAVAGLIVAALSRRS